MISIIRKGVALAVLPLCAWASPSLSKSVGNGGFERPVVPAGSYRLFDTGSHFRGWTVVGAAGNVAIIGSGFSYCVALPAARGAQFLDLTGTSDSATGVQTEIHTQPGATYALSFEVGNIVGGGNCGTTTTVNLVIDGVPVASFTNRAGKHSDKLAWKKFSTEFTAENDTTTIAFINGDPAGDTGSGLDGVTIALVRAP